MSTPNSPLRLLVLDDDRGERGRVVASLRQVEAEFGLHPLEIDDRGTPGELDDVVRRLEEAPLEAPPWDIILSDVLMPDAERGGLRVARAVRDRWGAGPAPVPVKVALVTAFPGYVAALDGFNDLDVSSTAGWLWFFAKGEEVVRSPAGELLSDDAWRRSLAHLVRLRDTERWGLRPLAGEDMSSLAGSIFRSPASTRLLTETASVGGFTAMRAALVSGEAGAGRELTARLLHFHAVRTRGRSAGFFSFPVPAVADFDPAPLFGRQAPRTVSQRGTYARAAGGTLFVNDAHHLPLSARIEVAERVRLREDNGGIERNPDLLVLGVEPGSAVQEWLNAFGDVHVPVVNVPPLRDRREDVVPTATALLARWVQGGTARLGADAAEWLTRTDNTWPRNFATLEALLLLASDYGQKQLVTAADLQRSMAALEARSAASARTPTRGERESILFVSALPDHEEAVRSDRERKEIRNVLSGNGGSRYEVTDCPAASLREMLDALRGRDYDILHFSGHGEGQGLLFEARSGDEQVVNRDGLAELLAGHVPPLRCVFLNCCGSESAARALARVVPYVIGLRGVIADDCAIDFAAVFYQSLARGRPIPDAFSDARRVLKALTLPGEGRAFLFQKAGSAHREP